MTFFENLLKPKYTFNGHKILKKPTLIVGPRNSNDFFPFFTKNISKI